MRYEILFEKNGWNAPTEEEKQTLVLQAQVNHLKKNSSGSSKNGNKNNSKNNNNKDENGANSKSQWMTQEPAKDRLTKPREWKNELWYWCGKKTGGKCEKYCKHKPSACGGRSYYYKKRRTENQEKPENKAEIPKRSPT